MISQISPEQKEIKNEFQQLLSDIRLPLDEIKNKKVLIKPNIGRITKYQTGQVVNPIVLCGLIEALQEYKPREIIVGESSLIGADSSKAAREAGVLEVLENLKIKFIDLKRHPFVMKKNSNPFVFSEIKVSKIVDDVDYIINLAKLKTAFSATVSLTVKNLKGLLPDTEKRRFHKVDLHSAICDLYQVVRPQLNIIDGLIGNGAGKPIPTNFVILGKDALAVDAIGSHLMGVPPNKTKYLEQLAKRKLGQIDLEKIEINEFPLEEKKIDFPTAPRGIEDLESFFPDFKINIMAQSVCSSCVGFFYLFLNKVKEEHLENLLKEKNITFVLGTCKELPKRGKKITIGNCCKNKGTDTIHLSGCPPISEELIELVKRI